MVFVSHTQDKDNPLHYKEKVAILQKCVPSFHDGKVRIGNKTARTLYDVLSTTADTYKTIYLVCGHDHKEDFNSTIASWKKSHPHTKISVISTPRHEDSMSGSLIRKAARKGDVDTVKKLSMDGVDPNKLTQTLRYRMTNTNEEAMSIKSFSQWITEAVDGEPDPPKDKPKPDAPEKPSEKTDDAFGDDTEDTPDKADAPEKENAPKPVRPLPPDATEDDGRVSSDTPANQSRLVIHPKVRLKFDIKTKANDLMNNKRPSLNNVGVKHYI